jgi:diguanylate cyclase (GGDEF)-like protein
MPSGSIRLNQNAVSARIVWPVAFILLSILVIGAGAAGWNAVRVNRAALLRQMDQLTNALARERGLAANRLAEMVSQPAILDALADKSSAEAVRTGLRAAMTANSGMSEIVLVSPDGIALADLVAPGTQNRFERLLPSLQPFIAAVRDRASQQTLRRTGDGMIRDPQSVLGLGEARIVHAADGPIIAAAVPLPGESVFGRMVAVAAQPLTDATLQEIAAASGLSHLRLVSSADEADSGMPLLDGDGDPVSWLVFDPEQPGKPMLRLLIPAASVAFAGILLFSAFLFAHVRRITIDLMVREAEATHQSLHDEMSGLPNRAFFTERLDSELLGLQPDGDGLAVFFLDLDRFKEINDAHGHDAGDTLICTVAKRLSAALRGSDTLARFGGDEFAIIQRGIRSPNDCATLAHRLLDTMREPYDIDGRQVYVGLSMGIALAPQNGRDRTTLMKLADVALYRAKHEGRNRYAFFEIGMDSTMRLRKLVQEELRDAIAGDRLDINYQPQFSADGRKITGVEALVRWLHPVHGFISPAEFIPIAEERGLIGMLGEWVLRRACRDGRRWKDITVAVNVSPIQFRQKEFVATISRIVEEEGMDPGRVELELTEGVIVEDADTAENAMMELRSLGFRFALDDFGTGYSSLIYLRRFAFDKIKIDRSFLESMESTGESAILVHSVVHLGRALGLTVTAEGVETPEQHRFLQAVGCHQLQGYLFSKPVSAAAIDDLLGLTMPQQLPGAQVA